MILLFILARHKNLGYCLTGGKNLVTMTRQEKILEALKNLSTSDMVIVHNEYCDTNRYYENRIEHMSEFDYMCEGMSPTQIVNRYCGGDFNTRNDYYVEGIYGATSFDYYDDAPTTFYEEIAKYCDEYEDALCCDDIQAIFDEEEDE